MDVSTESERIKRELEATRKTTLFEYIKACHDLVFTRFTVKTNRTLTSKSLTIPSGRRCPSRLEPWEDFLVEQRVILGTLFSEFPARVEAFRSRDYLCTRGEMIAATKVSNESTLERVLQDLVAEPVTLIIKRLQD